MCQACLAFHHGIFVRGAASAITCRFIFFLLVSSLSNFRRMAWPRVQPERPPARFGRLRVSDTRHLVWHRKRRSRPAPHPRSERPTETAAFSSTFQKAGDVGVWLDRWIRSGFPSGQAEVNRRHGTWHGSDIVSAGGVRWCQFKLLGTSLGCLDGGNSRSSVKRYVAKSCSRVAATFRLEWKRSGSDRGP